ncbi:MAG: helix-turn-helix transcriptional regulator [Rhodobiaceae bacterium]|nr:helix-turn-helix transcriptional regulator [Rhodobiaceae bacterium]
MTIIDKRQRSVFFRQRLEDAMRRAGFSRSRLAREIRVDRSTIGQLLGSEMPRLPNAQLAADAASVLGVSTDWLLGLTERPERPGDIVDAAVAISQAARSSADEQLLEWHREAAGYKIRHVPATLPDMLKTKRMYQWEYSVFDDLDPDPAIQASQNQLDWLGTGVSDYEIALPAHELLACAQGTGYYDGLDASVRHEQLSAIANLCDELYPRLRLFLFDAHQVYSAPVTIFGPRLAVIYVGRSYLAFRESRRVISLTEHFDWLVREAAVDARFAAQHIRSLYA